MSPGLSKGILKVIFFLYVWDLKKEGLSEDQIYEKLNKDFKELFFITLSLAMPFVITGLFIAALVGIMFFEEKYSLKETWWWSYFLKGSLGISFVYGTVKFAKKMDKANKKAVEKKKQKKEAA